ncbi:uncharacterized protein LOC115410061 [Sphaeramia orbicularis]|uniref:uncharacterized protein LOC115410061 n=1 Tax=Sphaeramia orbicularis TaxID=375764 RepID=UPI0011813541|nr:serine/threonine-protein kinase LMTK2 [Sphaeramia orbicularis]
MSGARRMQEFKYFRGGASLVVSLDGLNWFYKRRCRAKGIKKRDDDLQLWISAGHMIQPDEELQPITCLCICGLRGDAAPHSWMNKAVTQSVSSLSARHCCLLEGSAHQSAFTPLTSLTPEWPMDALCTKFIVNIPDIFSWITKYLSMGTPQKTVTMNQKSRFIVFCNEEIPSRLFCDIFHSQDCRTSLGITGRHSNNNRNGMDLLKTPTVQRPHVPNKHQTELMVSNNMYTMSLKSLSVESYQSYDQTRKQPVKKGNRRKWKSVSFADDVIVYLFDQESPTSALHPEPCGSTPSLQSPHSCHQSDVTFDDSAGLEWEDDFSALEKKCLFQYFSNSVSHNYTLSLPTQGWSALCRPERFYLSQTCLFLTHVTEADLEL